ncbi:nucleoside phosphorylase [Mucilaginibacter jinjuensis]|uniref:Nucleoside phosphorylase n=1 Tax=Mucilaginibacter jinjuensis TaxID=1176721 RepID=A0ABY7T1Z7_9SPHI|nr:nucleoside phosphorylase [Mucilaginibacter jinjuensis]WCT09863.1 nucleoside phosphorylase [Mucilaginibacter jinjuensis]
MQKLDSIATSELILSNRGAIYHLDILPEEIATNIITVGDPERVPEVSKHFDRIEVKRQHREFVTHTGYIGKKRLSVVSTGIGTGNIDIVLNELDALHNIDFETRGIKADLKQLNIVRIGTSGSVSKEIPVDSFLLSSYGLGLDNMLNFYDVPNNIANQEILDAFIEQTGLSTKVAKPYLTACCESLAKHFKEGFYSGITVTAPGFYGPQGRVLRLGLSNPGFIDTLGDFEFKGNRISNLEMETAGIYGLGTLLGHNVLSLNAILANRVTGDFSKNPQDTIDGLISKSIEILSGINN